jgi:hypothetical protein
MEPETGRPEQRARGPSRKLREGSLVEIASDAIRTAPGSTRGPVLSSFCSSS